MNASPLPIARRRRISTRRSALLAALGSGIATSAACAQTVTTTYIGPNPGTWNVGANWSGGVVPNNAGGTTYLAITPNATSVTMNLAAVLHSMTIGTGGLVSVSAGLDPQLTTGPLLNDGTVRLNGSTSDFRLGGNVTFDGTGQFLMAGSGANAIVAFGAERRLTNSLTHTIRGGGAIGGATSFLLTNHGLIEATLPSLALTVTLGGNLPDNVNTGVLQANGGKFILFDSDLTNVGGTIRAKNGSTFQLSFGRVTGGTFETEGTGEIVIIDSSEHFLTEVTNQGLMKIKGAIFVDFLGPCVNNGTIVLDGGSSLCTIVADGTTVFNGTGSIEGTGTNARIFGVSFTNGPEHTIRGGMRISSNEMGWHNLGVIEATNATVPLRLKPLIIVGGNRNEGVIRSVTGTIQIEGGVVDNTGGEIVAYPGRVLKVMGAELTGGELRAEGNGSIELYGRLVLADLSGAMVVPPAQSLVVSETLVNHGSVLVSGSAFTTTLRVDTEVAFLGEGEIVLGGSGARIVGDVGQSNLFIGPEQTLRGIGEVGANQFLNLLNAGTVVGGAGTLTIDVAGYFEHSGAMHVPAGSTVSVAPGLFTSTGTITVDVGGTLTRSGTVLQADGLTTVAGSLAVTGGSFTVAGGGFAGSGAVTGPLSIQAGTFAPHGMTLDGSLALGAAHRTELRLDADAPLAPQLAATGAVTLAGTIAIERDAGFLPSAGQTVTLLTGASIDGAYEAIESCDEVTLHIERTKTGDALVLTFLTGTGVVGDLTGDALVDGADLAAFLGAWSAGGPCASACCPADFTADGIVDGSDLSILLGAWGTPGG